MSDETTIRVLIVDDDALVRAGLRLLLDGGGIRIVGEAADGLEALDAVRAHRPDVVLMDIRMPRQDGIVTTAALRDRPPSPKVIVLTTFETDDLVAQALQAGAAGFLLKDTPPAQIVEAVRRVHAGEPMLSPSVTRRLMAAVARQADDPRRAAASALVGGLSEREREIADLVAEGLANAEIAGRLYLSVATVKTHIGHVMTKLGVDNRVQVAIRVHDARG